MATPVIMPRQGQSVESCIIGQWHKQKGDTVAVGDTLFTYETDKATFDEAAAVAGTILEVFFKEGDDVPCLLNVCVIGEPGEDISAFVPEGAEAAEQDAPATEEAVSTIEANEPVVAASAPTPPAQTGAASGAVSPRAKHLATRSGADLRQAAGTGPEGRVIERDVLTLIKDGRMATPAAGAYEAGLPGTALGGRVGVADAAAPATISAAASEATPAARSVDAAASWTEKHPTIRKVIARSMHQSLASMAQLTLNTTFDATEILAFRKRLKAANEKGLAMAATVPTIGDIVLYAVSRVLLNHAACNAHYDDEKMTFFKHVNLGVAIDTPRGLMVPTLFAADTLSLTEISHQVKAVADECRKGTINPDLLRDGTFTVTNLGTLGVESFTPVINPPQTCILGVCNLTTRVRARPDGSVATYQAMGLSLTLDHRAVDGAPAARMLQELTVALENFTLLLMTGGSANV